MPGRCSPQPGSGLSRHVRAGFRRQAPDIHTEVALAIWAMLPAQRCQADQSRHQLRHERQALGPSQGRTSSGPEDPGEVLAAVPQAAHLAGTVRTKGEQGLPLANGFGRFHRVDQERAYTQSPALIGQGCARDLMMEGILRPPTRCRCCGCWFTTNWCSRCRRIALMTSRPRSRCAPVRVGTHEGARPIRFSLTWAVVGNWAEVYAKD